MKNVIVMIVLAISSSAFANVEQYPTTAMTNAVVRNSEIKKITKTIESSRGLKCAIVNADHVDLQAMKLDGSSEFETRINCNDKGGGANQHQITFKGYTYNSGRSIESVLTSIEIATYE